jgi:hypothetical protein
VPIRFTRTAKSTSSTVAALDAACVAEYGGNYQLADTRDLQALWRNRLNNDFSWRNTFIATYSTGVVNSFYIANANFAYISLSATPGSYPVACVRVDEIVRFTRTTMPTTSPVATLDAACASAFGSSYQLADSRDLQALWSNALGSDFSNNNNNTFIATIDAGTVTTFLIYSGTNGGVLSFAPISGSFPIACVQLTP